jgi:hypothetical protein
LVGFGLFSMIDAGCYFTIGHALLKGRYFWRHGFALQ